MDNSPNLSVNFSKLIDSCFEDEQINPKVLQSLLHSIVAKLKLTDIEINEESLINLASKSSKDSTDTIRSKIKEAPEETSKTFKRLNAIPKLNHSNLISQRLLHLEQTGDSVESDTVDPEIYKLISRSVNIDDLRVFELIRDEIDSINSITHKNFIFLEQNLCNIQKEICRMSENMNDLSFGFEDNEIKLDEIWRETMDIKKFTISLNDDFAFMIESTDRVANQTLSLEDKIEHLKCIKANKDDQRFDEMSTKIEAGEKLSTKDFQLILNDLNATNKDLNHKISDQQKSNNIFITDIQMTLAEKLNKEKFKMFEKTVDQHFNGFLKELKVLLHDWQMAQIGVGGSNKSQKDLKCLCCQANISMRDETSVRLEKMSGKFLRNIELDKIQRRF